MENDELLKIIAYNLFFQVCVHLKNLIKVYLNCIVLNEHIHLLLLTKPFFTILGQISKYVLDGKRTVQAMIRNCRNISRVSLFVAKNNTRKYPLLEL
jgi:hypothetical protein